MWLLSTAFSKSLGDKVSRIYLEKLQPGHMAELLVTNINSADRREPSANKQDNGKKALRASQIPS